MSTWVWVVIVIVAVLVIAGIAWALGRRRQTERLREGFGPEYDRTVERTGDRAAAESELADRARRREAFELRPLGPAARETFNDEWRAAQSSFVDDPASAVTEADRLIQRAMRERGYPIEDFEDRAALVSVDHPLVVERYRRAHAIAEANEQGRASTEQLRQALQDYRALFMEIVDDKVEATR